MTDLFVARRGRPCDLVAGIQAVRDFYVGVVGSPLMTLPMKVSCRLSICFQHW